MHYGQLLKSASFKLAAGYVALFTISVGILAALIYFLATSELDREIKTRIAAESVALSKEYVRGGPTQLLQAITERQRGRLIGGLDYTLYDSNGTRLFGSLPPMHCVAGWATLVGPPDGDEPPGEMERLSVLLTPLAQGYCLLVGDDIGKVAKLGSSILNSFGWVFLLTVTMGAGGGILLSSKALRRIETINRTAEAIIGGDMNRRIPRRGVPDDLDRLAATLNRMLDRMTSLMENIRHVSNDVAHDLRTPLGRLRRSLEDARALAAPSPGYYAAIDRAVYEVDEILETFSAILRIAQIESGSRRGGFQRLVLSELVVDVCDTFAPSMEDAGKVLRVDIEDGLLVQGDRDLLIQLLVNLLENAMAHTPDGATITVSLKHSGGGIELFVADDGNGVPESELPQIFRRFYRVERSRTAAGSGLGLSIVAAVGELHGAKTYARCNNPGLRVGTIFVAAA